MSDQSSEPRLIPQVTMEDESRPARKGHFNFPFAAGHALVLLTVLSAALASAQPKASASSPTTSVAQTIDPSGLHIVTLRAEADQDDLVKEFGVQPRHQYRRALNGFAATLDSHSLEALKHDRRVLAVEPDGRIYICAQTNGAGIIRMGVTNFLPYYFNGRDNRVNVDVAVLDTGIQTNHPDLNVVNAVDFTGAGFIAAGHGTHVAGIIGALDNDWGVVGVAPGVRLWSLQVLLESGFGDWSWIVAGLDYIAEHADKIAVVNASLGGEGSPYTALHTAVSNVVSLGVVFVASAGNDGNDISGYDLTYGTADDFLPAALPEVMAVSAMDPTPGSYFDTVWAASNYSALPKSPNLVNCPGLGIDVAAPGVNILSTFTNSGYATLTGTSMASAHAAGLVALYLAANGRGHSLADVVNIRQAIANNSQPQWAWVSSFTSYLGNNTLDPDGNQEPLGFPSEAWLPPVIASAQSSSGTFQAGFWASLGYSFTLQYSDSLASTNQWAGLTVTNGTSGTAILTDATPVRSRFYRLARAASAITVTTNFTWSSSGDVTWFTQTNVTHGGLPAFQSGNISLGQQSLLDTTVVGPGVVSFWWQDTGSGIDFFGFYIDGVLENQYSAGGFWQPKSFPVTIGSHTLRWRYTKSVSTAGPAFVDEVRLTSPNLWSSQ